MDNILYIVMAICAAWVIYDVWMVNEKLSGGSKIIWTIFALFFSIITAVVYYFVGKK